MYYWNKICGLSIIFLFSVLFSASQTIKHSLLIHLKRPVYSLSLLPVVKTEYQPFSFASSLNVINQNYYTQHLGFMCKKELAFEKLTKLPLRFRLGSLQQCNYLEGKK